MDSEEYQATFPFPPLDQHHQEEHDPEEREPSSLHNVDFQDKMHSLLLPSARVPFTAAEAWTALTSPTSQEGNSTLLQGITPPSRPGGSRKKRATRASGTSGSGNASAAIVDAGACYSPAETFLEALTRAGVVPLPPHIRAISGKESNYTGLAAIHSQTAFFAPLPAFTSSLLKEAGADTTTSEDNSACAGHKLSVSTLKYRKQQLKAFPSPLTGIAAGVGGDEAAGSSGQGSSWRREIGLQLPEIASEIDTRGHNVVFSPSAQDSGARPVPLVHISTPSKPPSAAVRLRHFFFPLKISQIF